MKYFLAKLDYSTMITMQDLIARLTNFWKEKGCTIHLGYDVEVGAATFNPATFLRCLGKEPYRAAYVEGCRRPSDGRYGKNPNRFQLFHQFQVIFKPIPHNFQQLYKESLESIGLNLKEHDLRFVHDDWANPTIGAHGLGWEVWLNGMEITQYTYFQGIGGLDLPYPTVELAYGVERLCMYLQNVDHFYKVQWDERLTLGDLCAQQEEEWSCYNFEEADTKMWQMHFDHFEKEATRLMQRKERALPLPAFDFVMKASHAFNMLDARGAISVTERTGYITRIRALASQVASSYLASREAANYPLCNKFLIQEKEGEKPLFTQPVFTSERDDFILEIGSEELPVNAILMGIKGLEKAVVQLLEKEGILFGQIKPFATPRRLALLIQDLQAFIPDKRIERRGPALESAFDDKGLPTAQGLGFLRSVGVAAATPEEIRAGKIPGLAIQEVAGKEQLLAKLHIPGKSAAEILKEALPKLILSIDFPKKMHWVDPEITYARPLLWLLCMHGENVVPFQIGSIHSGSFTFGNSQLDARRIELDHPSRYEELLEKSHVIACTTKRRESIKQQLIQIENKLNLQAALQEKVISQVLYLTEYPQLLLGCFNEKFLAAPKEALISAMVEHQKYFALLDKKGNLTNQFIVTAGNTPNKIIREGNEKVISARLADAVFLYEQDLKVPFDSFNEKLKIMTFQKELGTVWNKVERITKHAQLLQSVCKIGNKKTVERAAYLCKTDLATALVGEFPELQGIAGAYYAKSEGEEVAKAIQEHWLPIGGDDALLPTTAAGSILSIADKLDNLIGYYAAGLKPTSSSDPYALRRQTIGIIKIILKDKIDLDLEKLLPLCAKNFKKLKIKKELFQEILDFFLGRARVVFEEMGFSKEDVASALHDGCKNPIESLRKLEALTTFRKSRQEEFAALIEVYKRAKGILLKEKAIAKLSVPQLKEKAEKELYAQVKKIAPQWKTALKKGDYLEPLQLLASLQAPMKKLFDDVFIDEPAFAKNRIALLHTVISHFDQLADFTQIR